MVLTVGVCSSSVLAKMHLFALPPRRHSMTCALKASKGTVTMMETRPSSFDSERFAYRSNTLVGCIGLADWGPDPERAYISEVANHPAFPSNLVQLRPLTFQPWRA